MNNAVHIGDWLGNPCKARIAIKVYLNSLQEYVISFKLWQKCENAIKTKRPHSSRLFQNLGSLFCPSHHPVVVVCFFLPFHTFPNPSALQCVPNMMLLEILNARATENVTRVCTDRESKCASRRRVLIRYFPFRFQNPFSSPKTSRALYNLFGW